MQIPDPGVEAGSYLRNAHPQREPEYGHNMNLDLLIMTQTLLPLTNLSYIQWIIAVLKMGAFMHGWGFSDYSAHIVSTMISTEFNLE